MLNASLMQGNYSMLFNDANLFLKRTYDDSKPRLCDVGCNNFSKLLVLLNALDAAEIGWKVPVSSARFYSFVETESLAGLDVPYHVDRLRTQERTNPSDSAMYVYYPKTEKIECFTRLDANENLTRLPQFEQYLMNSPQHRIRVYNVGTQTINEQHSYKHICIVSNKGLTNEDWNKIYSIMPLMYEYPEGSMLYKVLKEAESLGSTEVITLIKEHPKYKEFMLNKDKLDNIKALQIIMRQDTAALTNDLRNLTAEYERMLERAQDYTRRIQSIEDQILTANYKQTVLDVEELYQTLRKYKAVVKYEPTTDNRRDNTNSIDITVVTPLINYDIDAATLIIKRNVQMADNTRRVFQAIFVDQEFTLHACAVYRATSSSVNALSYSSTIEYDNCATYKAIPNTHIYQYACLGNCASMLLKAVRANNIEELYTGLVYSASNLNFADAPVLSRLIEYFNEPRAAYDGKCISDAEGNWYTITELKDLLTEREATTNEDA